MQLSNALVRSLLLAACAALSVPAFAQSIYFTTAQPAAVDGPDGPGSTQFTDGDIVNFNPGTGLGTIYLKDIVINDGGLPDMNALYVRENGNVIFSVQSSSADFSFQDDKLVEYNPTTDTLSLFYDFDGLITTNSDVDITGFHLLSNGNFLITNRSDFMLDSQSFENGDIVQFDPVSQTASLVLAESDFAGDDDIWVRGVSVLPNGNLLIAAFNEDNGGTMTLGGQTFDRGDLLEYDPVSQVGSLFLDSSIFGGATEDYNGIHVVPLPPAVLLFLSGLGAFGALRSRRG